MKKLLCYLKGYEKETVLAPLFKMLEACLLYTSKSWKIFPWIIP